jgi:hypothetical protein
MAVEGAVWADDMVEVAEWTDDVWPTSRPFGVALLRLLSVCLGSILLYLGLLVLASSLYLNSQRRLSSKVSSLLQFLFLLLRAAQVAVYSR